MSSCNNDNGTLGNQRVIFNVDGAHENLPSNVSIRIIDEKNDEATQKKKMHGDQNVVLKIVGAQGLVVDPKAVADTGSLMYPAYQQAEKAVGNILKQNKSWWDECERQNDEKKYLSLYGYGSNIIAFFGHRGSGKTSAMLSFAEALGGCSKEHGTQQSKDSSFEEYHFRTLLPIDPTNLCESDSILDAILADIMEKLKKQWENPCCSSDWEMSSNEKWNLLEKIEKCRIGIARIRKGTDLKSKTGNMSNEPLESLSENVDTMKIKLHLHEIIVKFLEIVSGRRESRKNILVIQLDDTDMKSENTYEMLEDVRKYLSLPNVIVLMASYFKQLRHVIEKHYKKMLGNYANEFDSPIHMAAKYIDKLIPPAQMVFLPGIKTAADNKKNICLDWEEKNVEGVNIEEYIYEQIFVKTGLVFIGYETHMHNIIPTTLRGINALCQLLEDMPYAYSYHAYSPDVESNWNFQEYCSKRLEDTKQKLENLRRFESYFLNDWAMSRLDKESYPIMQSDAKSTNRIRVRDCLKALDHNSADTRMLMAIQMLVRASEPEDSNYHSIHTDLEWILDDLMETHRDDVEPKAGNYVYVKLIEALELWETRCISNRDYGFPFALHTYFSIQLNKRALEDEIKLLGTIIQVKNISEEDKESEENKKNEYIAEVMNHFSYGLVSGMLKWTDSRTDIDHPKNNDNVKKDFIESEEIFTPIIDDNGIKSNSEFQFKMSSFELWDDYYLKEWKEECCKKRKGSTDDEFTKVDSLYTSYINWCMFHKNKTNINKTAFIFKVTKVLKKEPDGWGNFRLYLNQTGELFANSFEDDYESEQVIIDHVRKIIPCGQSVMLSYFVDFLGCTGTFENTQWFKEKVNKGNNNETKPEEKAYDCLYYYDYLVFLCCNWDVQRQFYHTLKRTIFECGKTSVGNVGTKAKLEDMIKKFREIFDPSKNNFNNPKISKSVWELAKYGIESRIFSL